jgi:SpoVK/Ycf46/Vps4 family AAA+-type ATPase
MKKTGKRGKQLLKTEGEWEWRKRYRLWDANRKIFLYPENWVEPELRLPAAFRVTCAAETKRKPIRRPPHRKGVRVLLTGKNRAGALVAAQTLARDLGKNLYRVDLGAVVSKYIGETEKNLRRVFDAAKRSGAVLLFDEADALFGKHTDVKDDHDRYANIETNYLLQRIEGYAGLAILTTGNRTKLNKVFSRRFHFVIRVPPRRKPRRRESSAR